MKCRNKGARSDADLFGLFWLGGLLDIMMRGGCGRGERIQHTIQHYPDTRSGDSF